jgi:hypothetical protein
MQGFFFIGLIALIAIGFAIYSWYAASQRRIALLNWARTAGLTFSPENRYGLNSRYPNFECLRQGDNQYAYNIMEGDFGGRGFLAFDYHYETYSSSSKGERETHHHYFSAVILKSDVPLKALFIRPENLLDKITAFVGFDDIDFESAEFSRKFYVKAPDKKWAYDVLHQRAMEFLLAQPVFTIQFDWNCAMAWRNGTFGVADFPAAAEVLRGLLDRLPAYLVQQQRQEFLGEKGSPA